MFCGGCGVPSNVSPTSAIDGLRDNFDSRSTGNWFAIGFSFDGRIGPGQYAGYWASALALIGLATMFVSAAPSLVCLLAPVYIVAVWVNLVAVVKRFRDAGLSFWWVLLVFVPFGGLVVFVMALASGQKTQERT